MKSVRLLPVVIFAALALLVFKGFSLLTEGSYVLSGPGVAVAEEMQARPSGEGDMSLPDQATLQDTSPTLEDKAPTIGDAAAAGDHGAPAASGEVSASASPSGESAAPASDAHGSSEPAPAEGAAPVVPDINCPAMEANAPAVATDAAATDAAAAHAEAAPAPADSSSSSSEPPAAVVPEGCPTLQTPTNAQGDALPTTKNGDGKIVPLAVAEGVDSERAVLERLAARRDELDKREADLNMRLTLVEAAEKRIEERTAELHALEGQIQALVDQRKAAEDEQFKSVVSMYESMKPKDAARIFDTLNMPVLLRVAQAMNPRKLAPILAAMGSAPAEALTTALASVQPEAVVTDASQNVAALPQIQGQ